MENDEKSYDLIEKEGLNSTELINKLRDQYTKFLKDCNTKNDNEKNEKNANIEQQKEKEKEMFVTNFDKIKTTVTENLNNENNVICDLEINDNVNYTQILQIVNKQVIANLSMKRKLNSNLNSKENMKMIQSKLSNNKNNYNNDRLWKFDFFHDYGNKLSQNKHGIYNNNKHRKIICNCGYVDCYCFYSICNFGMKPNSGKYKIKFQIDEIFNGSKPNMIGITSEKHDMNNINNSNKINKIKRKSNFKWNNDTYSYIGWSAYLNKDNYKVPNGLYCGNDNSISKNIFRLNKYIYQSNNKNYTTRLPGLQSGDIAILTYNSDLKQLSFAKENDNGKLDAYIHNLPKNEIFYWFVGHKLGQMSITILQS